MIKKEQKFKQGLKPKVFVAMSGGVDSSVAAALLQRGGYDVHGVFMKEWNPPGIECTSGDDRAMAARVAAHLQIPFAVWDFRHEYKKSVADYMLREYKAGCTPNPDVMCNRNIKFGIFLKEALKQGADFIATGHYIKLVTGNQKGANKKKGNQLPITNYQLRIARDSNKDQSYFLWTLAQKELQYCMFPIGDYEKPQVRELAKKFGLPSWNKKDSQGICFVGKLDFGEFLRKYLPRKKGKILTTAGKEIGAHDGVWFYTIGQRHGIIRGMKHEARSMENTDFKPLYVVGKNMRTNTLIVAEETQPELYQEELVAKNINWISGNPPAGGPKLPLTCKARIRYRQPLQKATILKQETRNLKLGSKGRTHIPNPKLQASSFKIRFAFSQRAVTPGQSIVFYKGQKMLGGGIIDR